MNLQAMIFDMDGVIADTSEYHYLSWQRLADEEGLHFNREVNERLRGLSRRASLDVILDGRPLTEEQIVAWMERKNDCFAGILARSTDTCLLPGVVPLIQELRAARIKVAVGSVSQNAHLVLSRLGIHGLMDVIVDGSSRLRSKPAPDIFLLAAAQLGVAPVHCAVVEDATAGIEAALAAGMWAIGLGPVARVGRAHARFDSLAGVTLSTILSALVP